MKLNNINKNGGIMKKLNAVYEAPNLEIKEMLVEQCVLMVSYGDYGAAGQDSGYLDYGDDMYL